MGSIAKAMKDAFQATGYSGAGKGLTFKLAPFTFDRLFVDRLFTAPVL